MRLRDYLLRHRGGGTVSGTYSGGNGGAATLRDDAPALQAAISAAWASGSTCVLSGTYWLPNGLGVPASTSKWLTADATACLVLGHPVTGWRDMSVNDPRYADIPLASRPHVKVASCPQALLMGVTPAMELHVGLSVQPQTVWPLPGTGTYGKGWFQATAASAYSGAGGTQAISYDSSDLGPQTWVRNRRGIVVEGWNTYFSFCQGTLADWMVGAVTQGGFQGRQGGWGGNGTFLNCRVRFRNAVECLLQEGQHWIDPEDGSVYWWPPSTWNGTQTTWVSGPGSVRLAGCDGLTVQGPAGKALPILGGQGNGIDVSSSVGVSLTRLAFVKVGRYGYYMGAGASVVATDCDFVGCGAGPAYVQGGDRLARTASNNRVDGAFVDGCSRVIQDLGLCVVGMAPQVRTSRFQSSTGQGIAALTPGLGAGSGQLDGANDALVEGNSFEAVGSGMHDNAAVYLYGGWGALGMRVRHNHFSNIEPFRHETSTTSAWCVYPDDGTSGVTIEYNTMSSSYGAVLLGGGWANTVKDNLWTGLTFGLLLDYRLGGPDGFMRSRALVGGDMRDSLRQWCVGAAWGTASAAWKAAYDAIGGTGQGVTSWMALYPAGGAAASGYGSPLGTVISGNAWVSPKSGSSRVWVNGGNLTSFATTNGGGGSEGLDNSFAFPEVTVTTTGTTANGAGKGADPFAGRLSRWPSATP